MTPAQVKVIRSWTAQQERTREAYRREPFEATVTDAGTCARCREKKHHRCPGVAWHRRVIGPCRCAVYDHERKFR